MLIFVRVNLCPASHPGSTPLTCRIYIEHCRRPVPRYAVRAGQTDPAAGRAAHPAPAPGRPALAATAVEEAHPLDRLDEPLRYPDPGTVVGLHHDRHVVQQGVPEHPLADRTPAYPFGGRGPQRPRGRLA